MSIRDEQRERVAERLAEHLLATGLTQTSLRALARAAGVSDRMLLYYFADKTEVLSVAAAKIAEGSVSGLAAALPEGTRMPPRELMLLAAKLTSGPEMRRFMRLWVEMIGGAAKGEEPFVTISAQVLGGFKPWLAARLDLPEVADRLATASAIIAMIDGLALVEICSSEADMRATHEALAGLFG